MGYREASSTSAGTSPRNPIWRMNSIARSNFCGFTGPWPRSGSRWSSDGTFFSRSLRYIFVEPLGEYGSLPPWKKQTGHVLSSNLKTGSTTASSVSPRREFTSESPSDRTYAGHIGIAKFTWHGMSSTPSTLLYAGVWELSASRSERCDPAEHPSTPIFSGSYPRSAAAWRTSLTARCPSSQPHW